jgi:hypothetical protein
MGGLMRANQWYILGLGFLLIQTFFIYQDMTYERICGIGGAGHTLEEGSKNLTRGDLWCINTEIYDPFITVLFVMWIVCWVNGFLEGRAGRKEQKNKTPKKT